MSENSEFKGFARVEVMGHQQHIGWVETQAFGGAVLFRIDRPEIPAVEETLATSEWVGDTRCPAGTVVSRGRIPAASVLVGAGSIYRIIPCDEETALRAIRTSEHRPLLIVKLGEAPALAAGAEDITETLSSAAGAGISFPEEDDDEDEDDFADQDEDDEE